MTVTRFAPSPTGFLHVGNLRTAALNWLIARKAGGRFLLRIDDTDTGRSEERFVEAIRADLDWLGLVPDEEVRQSARADRYAAALDRLRAATRVYECFETPLELDLKRRKQLAMGRPPVYDRSALMLTAAERARLRETRNPHLRFLLERDEIAWDDLIRGPQRVDPASISDPVLVRGDGQLLYSLASVVDDIETGVTHVVRGADHVTNTGAQIQLFGALGAAPPAFAHHSLLTGPQGEALSKRLGTLSLGDLREQGIEPLALLSFIVRLGSSLPVEPVTHVDVLVESFDIAHYGSAPTRFDPDELALLSGKTLRALPYEAVAERLSAMGLPDGIAPRFWETVGPNLDRMEEAAEWWAICRDGATPLIAPEDAAFIAAARDVLPPRPWDSESWTAWAEAAKTRTGRKGRALYMPLRRYLTGRERGPDMAALMPLLTEPRPTRA